VLFVYGKPYNYPCIDICLRVYTCVGAYAYTYLACFSCIKRYNTILIALLLFFSYLISVCLFIQFS